MTLVPAQTLARELDVSVRTVRRLVAARALREGRHYVRVGRLVRFFLDQVVADMAAGRLAPSPGPSHHFEAIFREELGG